MLVALLFGVILAAFVFSFCLVLLPEGVKSTHERGIKLGMVWSLRVIVTALLLAFMAILWFGFHPPIG